MDIPKNFKFTNLDYRFIKFLFVGVINTVFGYSIFALFLYVGIHYALALIFATATGIIFNFKTTGVLVFKNHDNRLFFKFVIVYFINYCLNVIVLKICKIYGLNLYIVQAIVIFPFALLAYTINKSFVFKQQ